MALRIVFMGTPEFAVPSLQGLMADGHQIVGVVTATDKFGGRGGKQVLMPAVKKFALQHGLNVLQPANLKSPEFLHELRALDAEIQVVVAFRMLPEVVWSMPPLGTINVHGSLLPAYRGAAPINWAIIRGERVTGVTTFKLQHEIDTGNVLMQREIEIGEDDTAGDLHDRMMWVGAEVLQETIRGIEQQTLIPTPQDPSRVSHAPKIHHDTCRIDFNRPAREVHNFIRGLSPYPTAWTILDGQQFNIFKSRLLRQESSLTKGLSGSIRVQPHALYLSCLDGEIEVLEVQISGKRKMSIRDFLNGYQVQSKSVG